MIIQKLKLERELEQTLDERVELENNYIRDKENLNLKIEILKADTREMITRLQIEEKSMRR